MMNERWVKIPGYEGLYEVSNMSRIKSVDRCFVRNGVTVYLKGQLLKQHLSKRGYWCVKLSNGGKTKTKTVHRFVGLFIKNPQSLPDINHKDGNKTNNHIDNLEWCNHTQNMQHAIKNGLINRLSGEDNKLTKKIKDKETGKVYPTIRHAVNEIGINRNTLVSYLSGHRNNKTNLVYSS